MLEAIKLYINHEEYSHSDAILHCYTLGLCYLVPEDAFAFERIIFVNGYEPVEYVFAKDLGNIVPAAYVVWVQFLELLALSRG